MTDDQMSKILFWIRVILCVVVVALLAVICTVPAEGSIQSRMEHNVLLTMYQEVSVGSDVVVTQEFYGSGVLYADGKVLTAAHCVRDCNRIKVMYYDGSVEMSADFYQDEYLELGIILVKKQTEELILGRVVPELGSHISVIANPSTRRNVYTVGIVCKKALDNNATVRGRPINRKHPAFMSNAAIQPGSSGGAVYFGEELIGIVSAITPPFSILTPVDSIHIFLRKFEAGEYKKVYQP